MNHLLSKRFLCWSASVIIFIVMIFLTSYTPLQLAEALTLLSGIYIINETIRGSETYRRSSDEPKA